MLIDHRNYGENALSDPLAIQQLPADAPSRAVGQRLGAKPADVDQLATVRADSLWREAARLIVPIGVIVLAVAAWLGVTLLRAVQDREAAVLQADAAGAASALSAALRPTRDQLRSMAVEPAVLDALDRPSKAAIDHMAEVLATLLTRNPNYALVSWVGPNGHERMRLNAAGPQRPPVRVAESELQDKRDRYYVREALDLPAGSLLVSALDLNVEQGRVELPHRPMLRMTVTVVNRQGAPAGLIVVNLEGRSVFDLLPSPGDRKLWLLNAQGDFLRGPVPEDDFAFMFGRRVRLADRVPALAELVDAAPQGTAVLDGRSWAWSRVGGLETQGLTRAADSRLPWVVVAGSPPTSLLARHGSQIAAFMALVALMLLVVVLLARGVAREKIAAQRAWSRAELAAQSKAAFLANISHEIRTPINAIVGLSSLLSSDEHLEDRAAHLRRIDHAARHLLSLVSDVLDLAKLDASAMTLEVRNFAVHDLLDGVAAIVAASAQQKGLTLRVDAGDLPDWLRGDVTRLRQALVNLAANAVKFTSRGHVAVRARVIAINGPEVRVRFEVEDTGPGIDAETAERLFQDFEQGHASVARRHGGTGMGLAITRRIARLMGGDASVDSRLGAGSTFWIEVQLQVGESVAHTASPVSVEELEASLRVDHRPARILVAEDDEVSRLLILVLLQRAGVAVTVAEDGLQVMDAVKQHSFDLVLLDMRMPNQDGLETTRQLRRLQAYRDVPIVALTANAFESDRQACLDAGMNDFLTKPIDPEALHEVLRRWLPTSNDKKKPAAAGL